MTHAYDSTFMQYTDRSSRYSAATVSNLLHGKLEIRSVLDVGCARGTWLNAWREIGVADVFGVDGDYIGHDDLVIPRTCFQAADLGQSIDLHRKFDLVQSLEVAEHIAATAADRFVENLVHHSSGVILFSAAPPGQGGEFHVNEQPYSYWRDKFRRHGFVAYDYVRPLIAVDHSVSFWYRYNTLLYVSAERAKSLPEDVRSTVIPESQPIPDMAPLWFRMRKSIVRALPSTVQQYLARVKAHVWR